MRYSGEWQGAFQNYPVDCQEEFRSCGPYNFDNVQYYIPNEYQRVPHNSYPMQSPYYNGFDGRVPPFHPDDYPSERQPWGGHQLNRPYQNEVYARNPKPVRRKRSHLHDIWGPNFDIEDEVHERNGNPTGSYYSSYNTHGPRNRFDNDRPRFTDPNENRFRVYKKHPKYKNADRGSFVRVERSSSTSANVSDTELIKEKVKPDDPKPEIADFKPNDDKKPVLENKLSKEDSNLSIAENSKHANDEQDTTLISSEAKISCNENNNVDIETMLEELENSDQNSLSINDIDTFKSFLDPYCFSDDVSVVDMDLDSPVSKKLKPHFTADELEKELSGLQRTESNINKVQEATSKDQKFNNSRRFSSEVENVGFDKKELQENSGRSKIRKRRFTTIDVSNETKQNKSENFQYERRRRDSNKSPEPNIKKRFYGANAESVPGSVERRNPLIEHSNDGSSALDETKRSTFFPNLRQGYKIPKNKPFSEPGKPFTSTVSLISQISQKDKTKDNSLSRSPKGVLIKPKSEVHSIKEAVKPNIDLKSKGSQILQSSNTDKAKSTKKSIRKNLSNSDTSCKRTEKSNSFANSIGSEKINIKSLSSKLCHKILSNNKAPDVETDKNIYENVKTKNRYTSGHSKAKKFKKVDSPHLENLKVTGKNNAVSYDKLNHIDENVQSKHNIMKTKSEKSSTDKVCNKKLNREESKTDKNDFENLKSNNDHPEKNTKNIMKINNVSSEKPKRKLDITTTSDQLTKKIDDSDIQSLATTGKDNSNTISSENAHLQISATTEIDNSKAVRSEKPKDAIDSETDKSIELKSHSSNDLGINKNKSTEKMDTVHLKTSKEIKIINNIKCTLDQMLQDFNIRSSAKLLEHTACSVDENMENLPNSQPMKQIKSESVVQNCMLQIYSAYKSEYPESEKCEVLTLIPYPVLQKGRLLSVESECTEEAVRIEGPEVKNTIEVVQQNISPASDADVVEIKEHVDIIDLTDITDESTNTTHDSMNNIDSLKQEVLGPILGEIAAQSSEIITMYRDEETQNENEEFLAISASFLPSSGSTGMVKSEINCAQQEACTNNENSVSPKESNINKLDTNINRLDTMNREEQVNKVHGHKTVANSNLNIAQNVSTEPNLSAPTPNAMLTLETGVSNKDPNISCNIRTSLGQETGTVSNAVCNDNPQISQYGVSAKVVESTVDVPIHASSASIIPGSQTLLAPVNPNIVYKNNVPPQPVQITPDNENNRTNQNADGSLVGVMSAGKENNRTKQNADGYPVGAVPAVQTSFRRCSMQSSLLPVGVLNSPRKPNVVCKNNVPPQKVQYTPGNENNRTNQNADGSPVGGVSSVQTSFCGSNTFLTSKPHSSGCLQDFESSRTNTHDQSRNQPPSNTIPIQRFSLRSSWERYIAELIVLAVQYCTTCEQIITTLRAKNVADFLCQDEVKFLRSVKSNRIHNLANRMKCVLSEIRVTECVPNHVLPIIFDFLKLYGIDNQATLYYYFYAMMMVNENFYVNNANLRNLYRTVQAYSMAIIAKRKDDISKATGTLTEEQLSTLNRQIEFCNMITSYLRHNLRIQPRIGNTYNSNSLPQTSSPLQQRVVQNMNTTNMSIPNYVGRPSNLQQSQLPSSSLLQNNSPRVNGFILKDLLASSAPIQSLNNFVNNSNPNTPSNPPNGVTNETIFNRNSRVLVPPSSQMKIGSQYPYRHTDSIQNLRFVRRMSKASSSAGSGTPSSTPMSSLPTFGTSPSFNAFTSSRQISPNGVPSTLREETPIRSQPSAIQNRRHIYAPMPFSPTYVSEPVVSPNTDSSGYSSNESPINNVPVGIESPNILSPNNAPGINRSSVDISTLTRQPDDDINSSTNVSKTSANKSSDDRSNSHSSPSNKTPLASTPAASPIDASVGNVCLKKELPEVNNEIQIDTNNENPIIIDLTWLDNMDSEQLKQELDFIKHEEFDEDDVVLNEEQFPLVDTDDLYEGRLCICEKQALLLCECRAVMYCGRSCQKRDWAKHKQLCLQEMARVQK